MAQAAEKVPFTVQRTRRVNVETFKIEPEQEVFLKFLGPMIQTSDSDNKNRQMKAPVVARVVNLASGVEGQIIVPTVLKSTIEANYRGDDYVGKCFAIVKHAPDAAKKQRYSTFDVDEIADPEL